MTAAKFLIAVSAVALSASAATAQTNTNTNEVSQTGSNNLAAVDNARAGNQQNRSSVIQNGRDNQATLIQIGNFNASQIRQLGDRNVILHTQDGNFHRAESFEDGNDNGSAIRQRGQLNIATVDQVGRNNVSQVAQGAEATATRDFTYSEFYNSGVGADRLGDDNRATVSQVGDNFSSNVRQRAAAGSGVAASNNIARVRQRGGGNSSSVVQESRGNVADVYQFAGGNSPAVQNITAITQGNSGATSNVNPMSNNRADVSVAGQANSSTVSQDGQNNVAEVTQGLGQLLGTHVSQSGSGDANLARVAQYGVGNNVTVVQDTVGARADVWQQAGPNAASRSSNNSVEVQQGTGTTGSASFSAAFFSNSAPTGDATRNLVADITQGNNPTTASWNIAQVRQDGIDLTTVVQQAGTGSSTFQNIVRVAQQGTANTATAIQRSGVAPSSSADTQATGRPGDEFFFAGGARSAEINILQSGSRNSASVEQRGRGQFARIEQGPGSGNLATIVQDMNATNATAIIRQTGSDNSYSVAQTSAGQYILISQTGNNNTVTNVIERP